MWVLIRLASFELAGVERSFSIEVSYFRLVLESGITGCLGHSRNGWFEAFAETYSTDRRLM